MPLTTEVLVVGAGPGGYVAAIKLGKLGKKALLVDKDKLGGECLNYGCIPSKALINSAGTLHKARKLLEGGAELRIDWAKVQTWKSGLIGGFNRGIAGLAKGNNVALAPGAVKFTGPNSAELKSAAGTDTVQFQQALIVTGSRPIGLPNLPFDGMFVLSSKEALDLAEAPKNLVVVGGGVIGLEIGTFFAKLGSKVTVVEFLPQLLTGVDPDLIVPVARNLQKLGIDVLLQSKAKEYVTEARSDGGPSTFLVAETPEGMKSIPADKILLSVGRAPNTAGLGLDAAGVATDPKGHILVDKQYRTNVPSVYAVGDVIGPPYLAHKASREGILAACAISGQPPRERGAIPTAIFTDPEIASVGETEAEAKARGVSVLVGRFPFSASGRAQAAREPEGFVKVVADRATHKLLGAGFVGPGASDLVSEACLALKLGATIEDIADTIHPHPTLPEAFQEAAEACLGEAIHILAPKVAA